MPDAKTPDGQRVVAEIPGDQKSGDDKLEGEGDDGGGRKNKIDEKEQGQEGKGEGIAHEHALERAKNIFQEAGFGPRSHA